MSLSRTYNFLQSGTPETVYYNISLKESEDYLSKREQAVVGYYTYSNCKNLSLPTGITVHCTDGDLEL